MECPNYTSFLVRLWRGQSPQAPGPTGDWQGEVEHIQDGAVWTVGTLDEALALLRGQVEGAPAERAAAPAAERSARLG